MLLHEFMADHRDEILRACRQNLHDDVTANGELDRDVELFFDEVQQALRRDSGHPEARSPLPGPSETAARLGQQPQRSGIHPAKVPFIFGAISNAIGLTGQRYDLSIGADEYQIFNRCIDTGVATSIENFWEVDRQAQQQKITERFGYLAHELRNALGNASLAFKLLRSGELTLNGPTAQVLGSNLTRMEMLIARTLGSVQLDSGVPLELRPVRVASVLRSLQASSIPERAISIGLDVDETLYVSADEVLLTSAVSNLVNNAIKFSCSGARIVVGCRAEEQGVVIDVEDECGGLPEGDPRQLFAPFVKGNESPKNLGLGLAITERVVAAMGGEIHVENHPGRGCTFSLLFPLARRPSSVPPRPSERPPLQ